MTETHFHELENLIPLPIRIALDGFSPDTVRQSEYSAFATQQNEKEPLFSPSPIALLFNSKDHTRNLLGSGLLLPKMYQENIIVTDWVDPRVKKYLLRNTTLYLILILVSRKNECLDASVAECLPPESDIRNSLNFDEGIAKFREITTMFLCLMKDAFDRDMRSSETGIVFFRHVLLFFWWLKQYEMSLLHTQMHETFLELGRVPSHLILSIKRRLHLVSYMPQAPFIFSKLQEMYFPRLYLVNKGRKETKIPFEHFCELCRYLPERSDGSTSSSDDIGLMFRDFIYKTDQTDAYWKRVFTSEGSLLKIPSPPNHELFLQAIAFQMENWEEIWVKMRWRRDNEMQRRLRYCKESRSFITLPIQWIAQLFMEF